LNNELLERNKKIKLLEDSLQALKEEVNKKIIYLQIEFKIK